MARLAGSVHGVVVHMRIETFFPFNTGNFSERSETIGNLTYIDGDFRSLYSISASASAVLQLMHQ